MAIPNQSMQCSKNKTFVLDTSVLLHDPTALFRFKEHDIHLPMAVLEELDATKIGTSEIARNARQVSRFIDQMLEQHHTNDITEGVPLQQAGDMPNCETPVGRLWFQVEQARLNTPLPGNHSPDHSILADVAALQKQAQDTRQVILVTKDINLRIKARILGLTAQDYLGDQVVDDTSLLHTGIEYFGADFWEQHGQDIRSWQEGSDTLYRIKMPERARWNPNHCLLVKGEPDFMALVHAIEGQHAILRTVRDFRQHKVWGIEARNAEQSFALNLLLDDRLDFVSLVGPAGTGKTLLALSAGLSQSLELKRFREIIMTRATVPVGDDIGFLPGTEEEKMVPWMGALMDNLEVLTRDYGHNSWEQSATADLINHRIKIRSLNFMRGRTFLERFLIIDEAQNLTPKQMRTLITRAGPGTKIVCLGNIAQIDTPYLTETSCGLTYVVERMQNWAHSGHIVLSRGERSRLADYATQHL